jgi:hypothetical protein
MKKILLLLIILFNQSVFAQAPSWIWVRSSDVTINQALGDDLVIDSIGNVYVIGNFESPTLILDSIVLTLHGINELDIFIAKYNPKGKVIWAKCFGGDDWDSGQKIKICNDGNLLIAGDFESPSISFGSISLINQGIHDVFLAKFDTAGNVLWAKSIYSNIDERCQDIAVDENNDLLITGQCGFGTATIHFDSLSVINVGTNNFLAKYNTSGNVVWAKIFGDSTVVSGLNTDKKNNIYLTGNFPGECTCFGSDTLTSLGYTDIFLTKLDSMGDVLWAKSWGGASINDEGSCVKIDPLGNIYIAGQFGSPYIIFSSDTVYNNGVLPYRDVFCAKLDSSCNAIWADSFGGWSQDFVYDIDLDQNNNPYLTGMTSLIYINVFLVKYDSIGNMDWYKIAGGTLSDRGHGVACTNGGSVYVTGVFTAPATFDAYTLVSSGFGPPQNFFLAKTDTVCGISISVNNPTMCEGDSVTITATGATNYTWNTGYIGSSFTIAPLATTTYTVTGTDSICRGFAFATVTVNPIPPVPIIQLNGDSLISNAANGNQWYIIPGGLITGAVYQRFKPSVNGYYYVIVTDSNGCISDSSNHIYYNTFSVQDFDNDSEIVISPNPNHGQFSISFRETLPIDVSIMILNSFGVQVFSKSYNAMKKVEINLKQISSGIYSIIIEYDKSIYIVKLIII